MTHDPPETFCVMLGGNLKAAKLSVKLVDTLTLEGGGGVVAFCKKHCSAIIWFDEFWQ